MSPNSDPTPISPPQTTTTPPTTAETAPRMPPTIHPQGPPKSARHVTVFIIMDAGRSDYVRPETMPFVHGLAASHLRGSFESPPGFAQRTVLFSGR
ncbi:MAG: hypothetical protein ACYC2H_09805 [Thermoplasmatota archaeon]